MQPSIQSSIWNDKNPTLVNELWITWKGIWHACTGSENKNMCGNSLADSELWELLLLFIVSIILLDTCFNSGPDHRAFVAKVNKHTQTANSKAVVRFGSDPSIKWHKLADILSQLRMLHSMSSIVLFSILTINLSGTKIQNYWSACLQVKQSAGYMLCIDEGNLRLSLLYNSVQTSATRMILIGKTINESVFVNPNQVYMAGMFTLNLITTIKIHRVIIRMWLGSSYALVVDFEGFSAYFTPQLGQVRPQVKLQLSCYGLMVSLIHKLLVSCMEIVFRT